MYDNGEGVPENDAEAGRWYRAAAEQGYASAQFNLGLMYANGEGIPENDVLAYAWINLAGAQGVERAQEVKDLLSRRMTSEQCRTGSEVEQHRILADDKPASDALNYCPGAGNKRSTCWRLPTAALMQACPT